MNDPEIRVALIAYLSEQLRDEADSLIAEEINVRRGSSRVDLAVVSHDLHGFEIKSRVDNLSRLPDQLDDYTTVFDRLTVVTGVNHLTGVLKTVPEWCGVMLASRVGGEVEIEPFREARANLHRDRRALAELLWREEALMVLERRGHDWGVRSKPRAAIWDRLAEVLPVDELATEVRDALLNRTRTWRRDSRGWKRKKRRRRRRR